VGQQPTIREIPRNVGCSRNTVKRRPRDGQSRRPLRVAMARIAVHESCDSDTSVGLLESDALTGVSKIEIFMRDAAQHSARAFTAVVRRGDPSGC
jgi:hypothetical protein